MRLIVGLGNPGREYQGTRHNIGWDVIDTLARRHHIYVKARRNNALVGEGAISDQQVVLAKPITFMNLSGHSVSAMVRRYRIKPADIIVICDDVNLPLGKLRIRAQGSAGGHNGLKSIIHCLGTDEFPRIRMGVGAPRGEMVDHVLSRFRRVEMEQVRQSIQEAANAAESILESGIDAAMNRFNASK